MSALLLLRGLTGLSATLAAVKLVTVLEATATQPGLDGRRGAGLAQQGLWSGPPQLVSPAQANTPGDAAEPTRFAAAGAADRPASDAADGTIAAALRARREALDERERALALREQVIEAAERRLAARVSELTALQRAMEAQERAAQERDEAGWTGLARLYEAMRPRDAAVIFNQLDMPILVQVVNRMAYRRAAPVLAAMDPDRARQLTAELTRLRAAGLTPAAAAVP